MDERRFNFLLGGGLVLFGGGEAALLTLATNDRPDAGVLWVLAGLGAALGLVVLVWVGFHTFEPPGYFRGKPQTHSEQVVETPLLDLGPTIHPPSIKQGNRPGWSATCRLAPPEHPFGRGVILSLHGSEQATGVVCRVFDTVGGYYDSQASTLGTRDEGSHFSKHYPGEFGSAHLLKGMAPYRAVWLGNPGDPVVSNDVILAESTFDVDDVGRPFCT